MKKLLLLLLIFAIQLAAMEAGKGPETAVPEMAATSSAAQQQKIEKKEEVIIPELPRVALRSELADLPADVKKEILKFLVEAPGDNNETRLRAATQNIRNFIKLNKAFKPFLDNMNVTQWIIQELAKRYTSGDLIRAALALHTDVAGKWLAAYVGSDAFRRYELGIFFTDEARLGNLGTVKLILKYFPQVINARGLDNATALIFAAKNGKSEIVEALLHAPGIDVNAFSDDGSTALILATEKGHTAIVEKLLQMPGIDVNRKTVSDSNALLITAEKGNTGIIERLLQVPGIDVNVRNSWGSTALMLAIAKGYTAIVERLLQVPAIDVNAHGQYGGTALMWAAAKGYTAIVEKLLQMPGIDVNLQIRGSTALDHARESNSQNKDVIIKLLLDHGAIEENKQPTSAVTKTDAPLAAEQKQKIEKEQTQGKALVSSASARVESAVSLEALSKELKKTIFKFLVEAPGDTNETRLRAAAQNIRNFMKLSKAFKPFLDDTNVVQWVIQELAKRYTNGDLIRAAGALQTNAAGKWLAGYVGYDNSKRYELGRFLTDEARLGNLGSVKLILKYFPQVINARGVDNTTALMFAAKNGKSHMVEALLQVPGIDVNAQNNWGASALSWAAQNGYTAIVERLLQVQGINVNIQNSSGGSPLIFATWKGHKEIVEKLLQVPGINVNLRAQGLTALSYARTLNNPNKEAIIKLLIDHGAVE